MNFIDRRTEAKNICEFYGYTLHGFKDFMQMSNEDAKFVSDFIEEEHEIYAE